MLAQRLVAQASVTSIRGIFGDWVETPQIFAEAYASAQPYEHVVIPGLLRQDLADEVAREFPDPHRGGGFSWKHYDNPIEQKFSLNEFDEERLPTITRVFEAFQSVEAVALFRKITGIADLEADPLLHGAGLHAYPSGGKLDAHLDYQIHPLTGKERRVNLIVYLNRQWEPEWGGALELWNSSRTECTTRVTPGWNTAALFRTSDVSYHGLPRPLSCPNDEYRRSLAVYYVSPPREGLASRPKAEFFPDPCQEQPPQLARLYEIRKTRLITADDLSNWPTWRAEGRGWW